jgi:O-antigen/teichoic acid export membrane protein
VASILGSGVYGPLNYFFVALAMAAFVIEAWAFVDAIIRPKAAFASAATMGDNAAQRLTKPIWLIILGVAFVIGLYSAAYGGAVGFLSVLAFVAAAVYLAGVRPKVREYGKRGSRSSSGPYGPW